MHKIIQYDKKYDEIISEIISDTEEYIEASIIIRDIEKYLEERIDELLSRDKLYRDSIEKYNLSEESGLLEVARENYDIHLESVRRAKLLLKFAKVKKHKLNGGLNR